VRRLSSLIGNLLDLLLRQVGEVCWVGIRHGGSEVLSFGYVCGCGGSEQGFVRPCRELQCVS
jgi:hypothetical protein